MKKILILILVMLLLVGTVNATLKTGYHFDNTVEDYIGIYDTYSSNSLIFETGAYGNSLNYINSDNVVKIITDSNFPTRIGETGIVTMNFWYYKTGNPSDTANILGGTENINNQLRLGFEQLPNGSIWFYADRSGTGSNLLLTPSLNNNTWYMITGIYNNKNMKLYINGLLNNSGTYTQTGADINTANLSFGRYESDRPYTHRIDEFLLFNDELTASDILNRYSNTINFTITSYDNYNLSSIYNFNATIDGVLYNSNITTGQLITPILQNSTDLHNISIYTYNYLTETYTNYNVSTNIYQSMTYYKSRHLINATVSPANTSLITNFSITTGSGFSGSTTSGSLVAETLWNTSEVVSFISPNYQLKNWTTTGTTNDAYQFNVFTRNSFDLNFFDEITRGIVSNVTIQLISDIYGNNYSTSNGTKYIDLLTPATYTIRYESDGYDQRTYVITLTNMSYNLLNLYLLNSSYASITDVTATVYDNIGNALEGAVISVQKYDGTTNSYQIMNRITTNFEGKAVFSATNNEYYKFLIEYPLGTVVYESSPTYIYSATMSFIVQISDEVGNLFTKQAGISYDLSYLGSDTFKFIYTDANNYGSNFCLRIYQDGYIGETLINSSCSTSNSATLYGGYVGVNGTTYNAKAYVTIGGKEYLLDKITNANPKITDFGKTGLFIIAILTIAVMCLSLYNIVIALLLTPIPLFLGAILGIVNISVGLAGGVWVGFMILAVIIGNRT
jgi:hypothetical protein